MDFPQAPRETPGPTHQPLLTVEDVARILRVSHKTVYNLVSRNELPHRRVGRNIRFSASALHTYMGA